jgi:protein-S-isoprenylcysteine O-methyltransferase Ste14
VDPVRYFLALITLLGLVPGLLLWFFIHPFAGFWRRLGPAWTYAVLSVPVAALMVAVFQARGTLLETEYGTHNYLALYVALPLSLAALYLIVILEEKELRNRFGSQYEKYCHSVPRFIPRRAPRA